MGENCTEGTALRELGSAYGRLGDFDRAIGYYERSQNTAKEVGDRAGEATTLFNLGVSFESKGSQAEYVETQLSQT